MSRAIPPSSQTQEDDALALETNSALLEAVDCDSARAATRSLEDGAGPWAGSSYARSADPEVNPVLRAILSPHGPAVLKAMDGWLTGVADWDIGGWKAIHWAVAHQNEWAVTWSLQNGRGLDERENQENGKISRTALMLAVQLGTPEWLDKVLDLNEEWGMGAATLIRADAFNSQAPTAIGVALYEMGARAMDIQTGKESSAGQWDACAEILSRRGFSVDSRNSKRPTQSAKLACAIALADEGAPGLNALQGAVRLGLSLAHAQSAGIESLAPQKPFDAAGDEVDLDWRRALLACGFMEGQTDGCWASKASKKIRDWALGEAKETPRALQASNRSMWTDVAKTLGESFAAAGILARERPMRGLESEFALWAATKTGHEALSSTGERKTQRSGALTAWKERLQLADIAAESTGALSLEPTGAIRLAPRRV